MGQVNANALPLPERWNSFRAGIRRFPVGARCGQFSRRQAASPHRRARPRACPLCQGYEPSYSLVMLRRSAAVRALPPAVST